MQTQNALNDNLAKFVLVPLGGWLVSRGLGFEGLQHVLALLLVVPFIVFAPTAGWLADRFPKSRVVRWAAWMQLAVFGVMVWALARHSFGMAMLAFFLLAVQSALLSPAKMGVVKELIGSKRLAFGSGVMEGTVILAILGGQISGGFWFDANLVRMDGDGWSSALVPVMCLWVGGIVSLIFAHGIQPTDTWTREPLSWSRAFAHVRDLKVVWGARALRLSAMGVAFFWGFAGFMNLVIIQIAEELYGGSVGFGSGVSLLLVFSSLGIATGSLAAGVVSRKGIELGLVPLGGVILSAGLVGLGFSEAGTLIQNGLLVLAGFGGAVFLVPLSAYLMDHCPAGQRGVVLSASNLLNNVAGVMGVLLQLGLKLLGFSTAAQFAMMLLVVVPVVVYVIRLLPREFVKMLILGTIRTCYRIEARHAERMPESGGVLLTPNHVSYVDAFVLAAASPRHVRFLMVRSYFDVPMVGRIARMFDTVPISATRAKDAIRVAAEALGEGSVVCIFPEGQLSRDGILSEVKNGFSLIARKAGAVVMPVYMDGLWGSVFSCERGKFFWKKSRKIPYGVRVVFGEAREARERRASTLREEMTRLSGEAMAARKEVTGSVVGFLERAEAWEPAAKWWEGGEMRVCTWRQVSELMHGLRRVEELAGPHVEARRWLVRWQELAALPEEEVRGLVINALQLAEPGDFGEGRKALLLDTEAPEAVCQVWGALVPVLTKAHVVLLGEEDSVESLARILLKEKLRDAVGGTRLAELLASGGPRFDALRYFHFDGVVQGEKDGGVSCFAGHAAGGRVLSISMPHAAKIRPKDPMQAGWKEGTLGRLLPGFSATEDENGLQVLPAGGGGTIRLPGMTMDPEGFVSPV